MLNGTANTASEHVSRRKEPGSAGSLAVRSGPCQSCKAQCVLSADALAVLTAEFAGDKVQHARCVHGGVDGAAARACVPLQWLGVRLRLPQLLSHQVQAQLHETSAVVGNTHSHKKDVMTMQNSGLASASASHSCLRIRCSRSCRRQVSGGQRPHQRAVEQKQCRHLPRVRKIVGLCMMHVAGSFGEACDC